MNAPAPDNDIEQRAATIVAALLFYAGAYMADHDDAISLMADDETLNELIPSDAALAILMVVDLLAAAGDLDADDIKVVATTIIANLSASGG